MIRAMGLSASTLLLAACASQIDSIAIDSESLDVHQAAGVNACGYRLVEIRDSRPAKDRAGGWDARELKVEEAPDLVRELLLQAGSLPVERGDGPGVVVDLKQMYVSQSGGSLVPTVVYEAAIDGGDAFVIRGQRSKMIWTGSRAETVSALSSAVQLANEQLMTALAKRGCD